MTIEESASGEPMRPTAPIAVMESAIWAQFCSHSGPASRRSLFFCFACCWCVRRGVEDNEGGEGGDGSATSARARRSGRGGGSRTCAIKLPTADLALVLVSGQLRT